MTFTDFTTVHRQRIESLEIEANTAWWDANITGTPEAEARAADVQKRLQKIYADRDNYAFLVATKPETLDIRERRVHTLLKNGFLAQQMESAVIDEMVDTSARVESVYNNHRPDFENKPATENDLRDVLSHSDDTARRQAAWEATKTVGALVEKDVLHLVALRNREAKRLGFDNYYTMALELQELNVPDLFTLLDNVKSQTDAHWHIYKSALDSRLAARFDIAPEELQAWHYGDPFFQESPPSELNLDKYFAHQNLETLTAQFFRAVGLPVEEILARSDLYEKPGKCQHAFCVHVGRFEDVRVLCNCTPTERWMGTMLHEFGHAVYDLYLGDPAAPDALPFFLREVAHTLSTEAIAMLMGRFARNAAWLTHWAGVPQDEAKAIEAQARREQGEAFLIFIRWCLVMTHFERGMYENPDRDLNAFWWDLVERFQNVRRPAERNQPDWAAKLHVALAPVYYQNYLLGEMFASQLLQFVQRNVLPTGAGDDVLVTTPALGEYLKTQVFAHGASLSWSELAQKATGEMLNPAYLMADLGG